MGKIHLGMNMEFVRHDDKPFEWGVEKAAELGYEFVEPMVHWGRELLSEAGYFHSVSMLDDPLRIRRACAAGGHQAFRPFGPHARCASRRSASNTSSRPSVSPPSAALRSSIPTKVPKPAWTTEEEDHCSMRYTLDGGGRRWPNRAAS